ncbi:MAG: hypothetical protein IJ039_10110 [Clostridia bacterium]|nr:hypothetical protein [Clostridia bacterium]
MKKEIEKKIIINKAEGDTIFNSYVDKTTLGRQLLKSYLSKTTTTDEKFNKTEDGKHIAFFNNDIDKEVGYLSDIYGYTGVLSLAVRMGVDIEEFDGLKDNIIDNVYLILDAIDNHGYTLYPYVTEDENRCGDGVLFGKVSRDKGEKSPYIGAMTWALSFFTSVRSAIKNKLITFEDPNEEKSLSERLMSKIKYIINFFNSSFIDKCDGVPNVPMGWGYTQGCANSSLFFTYSVLEAYSDFEDNVFDITFINDEEYRTVKDEELLTALNKGRGKGDQRLEEEWKENCRSVANHVWAVYKDVLKDNFVDDSFLKNYRVVTKDDILKSERSNALFNNIYLVSILLYGYVNKRADDKDDVVMTMEAALQNVQRVYNQLRRDGMEYLVDTYIIPFKSQYIDNDGKNVNVYQRLNYKSLVDASLMPMLVKANNIIAYYISQYPVKQMSVFYENLFDNMRTDVTEDSDDIQWIWENKGYDVKINERYIEAIADFYAYYEYYERDYADKKKAKDKRIAAIKEAAEKRGEEKARAKEREAAEKYIQEREQEIRSEYIIENAIRQTVENGVIEAFTTVINAIAEKLAGNKQLNDNEKKLYNSLEAFISSYIIALIRNTTSQVFNAETPERLKNDASTFLTNWVNALSTKEEVIAKFIKEDK